jgi:hypothetical protein
VFMVSSNTVKHLTPYSPRYERGKCTVLGKYVDTFIFRFSCYKLPQMRRTLYTPYASQRWNHGQQ